MMSNSKYSGYDETFLSKETQMDYPGVPTCDVPSHVSPVPELLLLCAPHVLDGLSLEVVRAEATICSLYVTVHISCGAETKAVRTNHTPTILQQPKQLL